jgi:crotonobetainyl-CoA:carnitine CoA-transferase CaiB-like acyl-CoA transferase
MGSPIKLSEGDSAQSPVTPPPALGHHTAEVLATIGIENRELEHLRTEGVV